jgi:phage terminase large subunit GpA-like protein
VSAVAQLSYVRAKGVLPPYPSFSSVLARSLDLLSPGERLSVSEAAEKYDLIVSASYSGPWKRDDTPYMVEPADITDSRKYMGVVFAGPARTGKTKALIQNPILKRMICNPCSIHVTQMDRVAARNFTIEKINSMLRHSPEFRKRLVSRGSSLGNTFDKVFRGDSHLTIGWPVASQLASRDIMLTMSTDHDKMPDDIEGEGDLWTLMSKRHQTFGSLGMSVAESSPRKEIQDKDFAPASIHEAPPCGGILGLYNLGTRGRYYWCCLHCSTVFEADFKHLRYEERDTISETAATTYLLCPNDECGGVMMPSDKHHLNQSENGAGWLHESKDGTRAVPLDHDDVRPSKIASYWMKGTAAAYQSWPSLVENWLLANALFEQTGDEQALRSTTNVDQGHPYLPRAVDSSMELSTERLMNAATWRELGVLPDDVLFVLVQVDVQPNRFVVQVDGYGAGLECWLIDRFDISTPPENAPGGARDPKTGEAKRTVQPHLYEEDWAVLGELHKRFWPYADAKSGLCPAAIIIDSGGAAGTTERAYRFWRKQKRKGLERRYYLYKGVGGENVARAKLRAPENQSAKAYKNQLEVKIVFAATDRLKDEVAASLVREEPGPGAYHLPSTLARNYFQEFCAEHRVPDKGWAKKKSHFRNESLDLTVMSRAVLIVLGAEKINWQSPVDWAIAGEANRFSVRIDENGDAVRSEKKTSAGAALAAAKRNMIKRR